MFDVNKLTDPLLFEENTLPPRADFMLCPSKTDLENGQNPWVISLDGVWRFYWARNHGQMIDGFEQPDFDVRGWASITVPSHMELEGYGVPQYANVQYPWDGREELALGCVGQVESPVGHYVKDIVVDEALLDTSVVLQLDGAESCAAVYVNGKEMGFSMDSFTRSEWRVDGALHAGVNRIAVLVFRYSAGSWLEDQDFFRFSGLFRSVRLVKMPAVSLYDVHVKPVLHANYTEGTVHCGLTFWESPAGSRVRLALSDDKGTVCQAEMAVEASVQAQLQVRHPCLWSAEQPNLYTLSVTLLRHDGSEAAYCEEKIGFRHFALVDGLMRLNGERIVFKGVNRHEFNEVKGRALSEADIRRDLLNMKRMNVNAVRTSHYPNQNVFYRLCDALGLYVIAENNMETHAMWDHVREHGLSCDLALPGNRLEWRPALERRIHNTYHRDKNRPSILMWSLGNESLGGPILRDLADVFRALDDSRLVHYEGVQWDPRYPETTDMVSSMYTPAAEVERRVAAGTEKPYILCEYAHAMGNSLGAFYKYTELAYRQERYQGGFIWDYIDQTLAFRDADGALTQGYGGDFGDRPNDGNFCGNGIVYGNGQNSPKVQEVKYCYQGVHGTVGQREATLHNQWMFTDLADFDCVLVLEKEGREVKKMPLMVQLAPGEKKTVPLPDFGALQPGEYAVTLSFRYRENTAYCSQGYEAAFLQGVFTVEEAAEAAPLAGGYAPLRVVHTDKNLGVYGADFSCMFSIQFGGMTSYVYAGKELLKNDPQLNFWRAPNDNDRGSGNPFLLAQWKAASMYAMPMGSRHVKVEAGEERVAITFVYRLPTAPETACSLTYTVLPSGVVEVEQVMDVACDLPDLPRFGMLWTLDKAYHRVRYYGLGPEENYRDRCRGARLGRFETTAEENLSRYLRPQECGLRTGTREVAVVDERGRGIRFFGAPFSFSCLHHSPNQLECARHASELNPPKYTFVCLDQEQMGVGGDDSWGAQIHPEFRIPAKGRHVFRYAFVGIV